MKNKRYLLSFIAGLSFTVANLGAGTYSWFFVYEPKVPAQLRK